MLVGRRQQRVEIEDRRKRGNELQEVSEEAERSRILSGGRKPGADRRGTLRQERSQRKLMQEICGLVLRDQGSFRLSYFLCAEREVDELGVSGLKRSEEVFTMEYQGEKATYGK